MRIDKHKLYGVVTGDVIASSRLSPSRRKGLHQAMTRTSRSLSKALADSVPAEVDIFRGDSWQMITTPAEALRAALFYRAGLRSRMQVDLRMAIAVGTIDFVPGNRVSEGDGEAFQLSGRALESMSRGASMRFRLADRPEERSLDVVVQLVDPLAARWSEKQALAVTGALQGWKQDKIAKTCWQKPISQQAVAQHLDRAAWSSIETGLTFFEETIQSMVDQAQVS